MSDDYRQGIIADTIRSIHTRTERGRCMSCRGPFVNCLPTKAADEIETLRGEDAKLRDRLAAVLGERDAYLQQLATANAEAAAFRRQRDEAREALRELFDRGVLERRHGGIALTAPIDELLGRLADIDRSLRSGHKGAEQ